jgi:hypothetical protein
VKGRRRGVVVRVLVKRTGILGFLWKEEEVFVEERRLLGFL